MDTDKNMRYFARRFQPTSLFLPVIGLGMLALGLQSQGRVLLAVMGGVLIALGGYQIVRNACRRMSGAELDAAAEEMARQFPLEASMCRRLCLEPEQAAGAERVVLQGYCPVGIKTQPLALRDKVDGVLRTSNYQLNVFLFFPERLYVYTYVRSLVDEEKAEEAYMYRYEEVKSLKLARRKDRLPAGDRDRSEEVSTLCLRMCTRDGENYRYAFTDRKEAERAEKLFDARRGRGKELPESAEALGE